jgi:hypothetical protein
MPNCPSDLAPLWKPQWLVMESMPGPKSCCGHVHGPDLDRVHCQLVSDDQSLLAREA